MFQIMKLVSHPNSLFFALLQELLTYTDVLRCYGMTMFVDVRLARLTSHADSVRTLPAKCQIAWGFFATNIISIEE